MAAISIFLTVLAQLLMSQAATSHDVTPAQRHQPVSDTSLSNRGLLFADVSTDAGIDQSHTTSDQRMTYIATGQAWGDYDNDGWVDLYLTNNNGANILYQNNQDGTFVVSASSSSVNLTNRESGGAVFADYNNDGWRDLYVLNNGPNALFHNDQGEGFTEVTFTAGVGDTGKGESATWGDYDQDGYLDLYVANWGSLCDGQGCSYRGIAGAEGNRDRLYHNNGDGTFSDMTLTLGLTQTVGGGFAATFLDYDNDGDPDLYLVNDKWIEPSIGNILWRNDGRGCGHWCFTDVSEESGADLLVFGMGIAVGDYDRDSDLDLYVSNISPGDPSEVGEVGPMVLLQNQGDGSFVDASPNAGLSLADTRAFGWGTIFSDFNNDGWQDLYLGIADMYGDERMPNPLFLNRGDGTFERLNEESGAAHQSDTLGVAYADYDRDGGVEFVIGNWNEGYVLYRNQSLQDVENHWLKVHLVGGGPINRDAIGSRVYVKTSDGLSQMQEVKCGSSFGSGNELTLHFGLGQSAVDELRVVWPDGHEEVMDSVQIDQELDVVYPVQQYMSVNNYIPMVTFSAHPSIDDSTQRMMGEE
ncbi:MAG: CRTAC1 family protein [Chloroflexota bacterium]